MRKIGILGGTFDPVHYGHLRIAVECKEALGLDELRMIPCALPSHRNEPDANAQQRLEMLSLALLDIKDIIADDRELKRKGYSYTVDTLESLKKTFPEAVFYLIIGSDSFQNILQWHKWQSIVELANIVIAQRPDHGNDQESLAGKTLAERFCSVDEIKNAESGKITCLGVSQLDISATRIRNLILEKRTLKFLLPDSVIQFIEKHNLYKD